MRPLLNHPTAARFARFAVVGASSTVIDTGLFWYLIHVLQWRPWGEVIPANCVSFTVGVTNGFFWNRLWTFRATEGHAPTQYLRFFLVNLVGLVVDTVVVQVTFALAGDWIAPAWLPIVAKIVAIPPVALWNFFAHSVWTFAPGGRPAPSPDSDLP